MTEDKELADIYAIVAIVAPQHKLQFFSTSDWQDPSQDFCAKYCQSLENRLKTYQERLTSTQSPSKA
jgi:hypothetical protein